MARTVPSTHDAEQTPRPNDSWANLVIGAAHAAATLLLTQAVGSILIASLNGAPFEFRRLFGLLPYAGITQQQDFVTTLTWSTALAVAVTGTTVLFMLWRRRDTPRYILGWSAGLPMAGLLLFFQYLRHIAGPPALDLWIAAQAAAFIAATALVVLAFFPTPAKESRS